MLQLIGYVLCAGMFAHGLSIFGNSKYWAPDEQGDLKMTAGGGMAGGLFVIAAAAFALWFYILGKQIEETYESRSDSYSESSMLPLPPSEMNAAAAESAIEESLEAEAVAARAIAAADAAEKAARDAMESAGQ